MQFPIYHPAHMGDGLTIGLEAVVHILLSHGFSIGVFALIVLSEYIGVKRASPQWESFAKGFIKLTALVITSLGSMTGVGMWFYTSALAPRAVGSMLRIFFWPWWIEWFAFIGELLVLLTYYYLWDKWQGERKMRHVYLGVSYTGWTLVSGFLITGIISFMLTSDGWPWSRSFWQAFFNPSFPPHLLLRLIGSLALASIISLAYLHVTPRDGDFRREASRVFGLVLLISTLASVALTWWYFRTVPLTFTTHATETVIARILHGNLVAFRAVNAIGVVILLLLAMVAIRSRAFASRALLVPAMIAAIAFVGEFEYVREFMRGPYLMPGYMYANQILLREHEFFNKEGLLKNGYWYSAAGRRSSGAGEFLFTQNCGTCHTVDGVNSIRSAVRGRTADGIYVILGHAQEMVPWMPPFSGTDDERRLLADYLYNIGLADTGPGTDSRQATVRR